MDAKHSHPYYPPTADIANFVPNVSPVMRLVPLLGVMVGAVVLSAWRQAARSRLQLRLVDRFAASWFALCGFLHVAFEGYYIYHRRDIAALNTSFAQLWKEYALSDSRYLTSDVFTVCVETITVWVWGPLSWMTFLAIITGSSSRHVLQVIVCTAHLYGVTLYYATNWTEGRFGGVTYSRPEFLYFWVYYVAFNLPWAVVPLGLLYDSFQQVSRAFQLVHEGRLEYKNN